MSDLTEERKEAIIQQYRQYLETQTWGELSDILTINKSKEELIKAIIEEDQMGQQNGNFEPV